VNEVNEIFHVMKEKGIKKIPGITTVEINEKMISVKAGDEKLLKIKGIRNKLNEWDQQIRKMGHFPYLS